MTGYIVSSAATHHCRRQQILRRTRTGPVSIEQLKWKRFSECHGTYAFWVDENIFKKSP
jgi:hypothetical protein